jgi:hypothetical protein
MLISHQQNAGQNYNIKTANKSFQNVSKCTYYGVTLTNKHCMPVKINSGLHSGQASCHSLHNILFPHLLSKNTQLKENGTIILPAFYMGIKPKLRP